MNSIAICISDVVAELPGFAAAFLVAPGHIPDAEHPEVRADRIEARVRAAHNSADDLRQNPLVEGYRAFHARINVRPSSASTPVKQALRVFDRGYRPINPVVDISMEIEYATLCSFQVYDLQSIGDQVRYIFAVGDEVLQDRAHGDGGSAKVRQGELLLADERGVIHAPSVGNDASRIMAPTSSQVLVRLMKIPALPRAVFDAAVTEACHRLAAVGSLVLDETRTDGILQRAMD
jgi:DNA/RNA-binding domain of Phe-tRNA-synthetase-like protein